ncbi:hypothetical protein CLOSTMETH_02683 [[Clostridium] methylpentosum DSM 5476]|uniref:Uncharacterized protein n=1 Tax=[Clostridium] methylpentosum DSM 5476 TaxID=537013 RepID=C0EFP1_9FIRM|nr:hypothetical protein CLOSTMETH_02683 [[Clostridium] methylpentosum DSM 5476]
MEPENIARLTRGLTCAGNVKSGFPERKIFFWSLVTLRFHQPPSQSKNNKTRLPENTPAGGFYQYRLDSFFYLK